MLKVTSDGLKSFKNFLKSPSLLHPAELYDLVRWILTGGILKETQMASAKYSIRLEPTHWVPSDERIAISADANNLVSAEFMFDALCDRAAYRYLALADRVEYVVELLELLSDDSLMVHKSLTFGEPLVPR
jgi:hypothetical protein